MGWASDGEGKISCWKKVVLSVKKSTMLQLLHLFLAMLLLSGSVHGAILFQEDFEDENLAARGFIDIAKCAKARAFS